MTPKGLTGKRLDSEPIHFHMKFTIDYFNIIKGTLRLTEYNSSIINDHEKEFKSFSPVCKKLLRDDSYRKPEAKLISKVHGCESEFMSLI